MTGASKSSRRSAIRATVFMLSLVVLFQLRGVDVGAQTVCFVQTPVGVANDEALDVVIQPDGKIVVAGYSSNGIDNDFTVIRYNADLSLDTSFGGTGIVVTDIGGANDQAFAVAIQSDGKIVAAGFADAGGGNNDIALVRYLPDGTLDGAFGTGGKVTTSIGAGDDQSRDVAIQVDGKIVVAGWSHNGTDNDIALVRYDTNGVPDGGFGTGGIVTTPIGPSGDEAWAIAIQPDGKIVVSGNSSNGTDMDIVVVRYDSFGGPDPSFGTGGIAFAPISAFDDLARDLAIQADGKIVTTGVSMNGADFDFATARFDAAGALDPSFSGGWVTTPIGPGQDQAFGLAIDSNSKLVLAGSAHNGSDFDLGLVRLNPDGTPDLTFDLDGIVTTSLLSNNDLGFGAALQADGRIVVVGSTYNGANYDHALVRYNEDGSIACGASSLHPISLGSTNTFSNLAGCSTSNWDCVNDQPGNVGVGPAVTDDGAASFLEDADGAINREMFALEDGTIPGGARVTEIQIHGQVGTGGGPTPGVRLSYQRMGWDGIPIDGPVALTANACCTDAIAWTVTGLNWSTAELDALEIGIVHDSGGQVDVSQLYVTVTYVETPGPKTMYRSIGTAADYTTGTVAATNGLKNVTGTGTSFLSANRGRGDRIRIDSVDYTIASVLSETVLKLTEPFPGVTGLGKTYTISRQFGSLQEWEDCISGAVPCAFFPVASSSLVADEREEVGIAYADTPFILSAPVVIDGSTTDKDHTITLTADSVNRHHGVAGAGVVIDGNNLANEILVQDDYVTIEWLEIQQMRRGVGIGAIDVSGSWGPVGVRLRKLLIHDFTDPVGSMSGIALSGGGGKEVKIRNTMIWNGDAFGIEGSGAASDDVDIDNVSIDNIVDAGAAGIDSLGSTNFRIRNTIVTGAAGPDFNGPFSASSSNNISSDGTAPGPNPLTASAATLFVGPSDLHLIAGAAAIDTGLDLSSSFTHDIDDTLRKVPWDRGADEFGALPPFRIHYRSIGTNAATLAFGTATVSAGSTTVIFAAPLTGGIGQGDRLNVGFETMFILSVDTATQVTIQEPATSSHSSESFAIVRAYNTLQDWETDRDGNLMTENRREVGVVYDDGPFATGAVINGSATDSNRYMMLIAAPSARHHGIVGAGALIDSSDTEAGQITIEDNYTVIDGLEIRRVRGTSGTGVRINGRGILLSNLLVHECKDGIRMSGSGGYGFTLRNSIVYANDDDGVEGDEVTDTMTIESCTLYGNGDDGLDDDNGTPTTVTNTISVANADNDFELINDTQSYNLTSDLTATGIGSLTSVSPTDNPSPGPGNWVVFESLTVGSENLHLKASAANLALDNGLDLSGSFTDDIDDLPRGALWDLGADELGVFGFGATISSAGNQSFVVGSSPALALAITVTEDAAGGNVTAGNDLRFRIPAGFNMRWDTSITSVTLGGTAAARVDASIKAYEDGGKTVVLDVTSDFFGNENLTVDGLRFLSFTAPSPLDNLELETGNDGLVSALDDKTIAIIPGASPTISSDADQVFTDGAPPTLASPITVTDASTPVIAPGNDIYLVIPAGLTMTWDSSILSPTFGGPAALKVNPNVTYVAADSTLLITVTTAFTNGDYLVISDLYFTNFSGPSAGNLELDIGAVPTDTDDKNIKIQLTAPVEVLTATSTNLLNHLEWVNPNDPSYVHTRILARDDGVFPTDPFDLVNARLVVDDVGVPGDKAFVHDTGVTNDTTYYYTAFVFDGTDYSAGVSTTGRPFDNTSGDVQWAYSTGATAMAPPALRFETPTTTFIYAVSNDSILHAMNGSGSAFPGEWPANWKPYRLGGLAQARPTVIPLSIPGATQGAVFLGSQDGTVYAIDADDGGLEWQSLSLGDRLLASPAGTFQAWGAPFDILAIGSWNPGGNNVFQGLNPFDGSIVWTFDNSSALGGDDTSMGVVSAAATASYRDPGDGSRLFFFATRADSSPDTVWCVKWDGSNVGLVWSTNLPGVTGSPNIDGSPIRYDLYGGRIYVGTNAGEVVALGAATGTVAWVFDTSDGAIKGFLFPRFGTTDLFFSTTNKVWSLSDDGAGYSVNPNWPATFVPKPSTPVLVPGSSDVLVGSSDGHLYQLDTTDPTSFLTEKLGDGAGGIGTPTVDVLNAVIYVGSEEGIFYAVTYPLTP